MNCRGTDCQSCPGLNTTTGEYCSNHGKCTSDGKCACHSGYSGQLCEVVVPNKSFVHTAAFIVVIVAAVIVIVVVVQSVYVFRRLKQRRPPVSGVDQSLFLVASAEEQELAPSSRRR